MSHSFSVKPVITSYLEAPGVGLVANRVSNTVYYADTDGFAYCWGSPGTYYIYSDANASPTTIVSRVYADAGGGGDWGLVFSPIKKGNYWKTSSNSYVRWIPMGE